jgi:hypothetical protein
MNEPASNYPNWLRRRPDESRDEWINRQFRSCYHCPHEAFRNATEASDHEDQCAHNPHAQRQRR